MLEIDESPGDRLSSLGDDPAGHIELSVLKGEIDTPTRRPRRDVYTPLVGHYVALS